MTKEIYNFISISELLICLLLISRYIYLEPGFRKIRSWILYILSFTSCFFFVEMFNGFPEDTYMAIPFLFFSIHIFLVRKKKRIRGIFLVLPITGMIVGILSMTFIIPYFINGKMTEGPDFYYALLDVLFWLLFVLFLWKGKQWRIRFSREIQYRFLGKWERNLLNITGLFLLVLSTIIITVEDIQLTGYYSGIFVVIGSISAFLLELSVIAMVIQGNKKSYYHNIADMNEHYLKAELEHFHVYQKAQTETRRIRHDMENHMLCLKELVEKGKYAQLKDYVANWGEQLRHIGPELYCGNNIADAICNEKNQVARQKNIEIRIEGKMPEQTGLQPIDICTIFANALDNAIEALSMSENLGKWILITIHSQENMQSITFENPVSEDLNLSEAGQTTKTDKDNHGFGILNMQLTVNKYHGQLNRQIVDKNGVLIYQLEIILFC